MTHFKKCALIFGLIIASHAARGEVQIPDDAKIGGYALGCQAYTFRRFTAFEAIEHTAAAGGHLIEFYPGQTLSKEDAARKLDHNLSDEIIAQLKEKLQKHHVVAVNYGVVTPRTEAEWRKVFEFAKKLGLRAVTSEPSVAAMDMIEKLVKEFDVMLAIHNHPKQPNNPNYRHWDPEFILSLVKDRDARLGSCSDIGHFVRSGVKPVDALRILKGRVISSHLKDLNEFSPRGHDVPFGTGKSDIAGVLEEFKQQGFRGNISIEYEHDTPQLLPEVAQCFGFVRGYTTPRATK